MSAVSNPIMFWTDTMDVFLRRLHRRMNVPDATSC